jgi:DNA-binding CsgD family transcriptional regulator
MTDAAPTVLPPVSPRELVIFRLLGRDGLTQKEVAARLAISVETVKWHCRQVRERLGVGSTAAAVHQLHDLISNQSVEG